MFLTAGSNTSMTRRSIPLSGAAVPDPGMIRTVERATTVMSNSGHLLFGVVITPASLSLRLLLCIYSISNLIHCASTDAGGL